MRPSTITLLLVALVSTVTVTVIQRCTTSVKLIIPPTTRLTTL